MTKLLFDYWFTLLMVFLLIVVTLTENKEGER